MGKSTVVATLLQRRPLMFSVSVTTRHQRPHEIDGVHYHFVQRAKFEEMIEAGLLLEWAQYSGNLYGTPKQPVEAWLAGGETVVLDIELRGARQIRQTFPAAVLIFIAPPSLADLEKRLQQRGDTDAEEVKRRLQLAAEQLAEAPQLFDHIVVNDRVDRAVAEIERILEGGADQPDHSLPTRVR